MMSVKGDRTSTKSVQGEGLENQAEETAKSRIWVLLLILLATLTRVVPHPWNFTGIGALALFTGMAWSNKWQSLFLAWGAMFLGDIYFGLHNTMVFTYGALALVWWLGFHFRGEEKSLKLFGLSLASSFIFYLISNFGVWLVGGMYPLTGKGLVECYFMGLPFLDNQVLGDLIYLGVLLSLHRVGIRQLSRVSRA